MFPYRGQSKRRRDTHERTKTSIVTNNVIGTDGEYVRVCMCVCACARAYVHACNLPVSQYDPVKPSMHSHKYEPSASETHGPCKQGSPLHSKISGKTG